MMCLRTSFHIKAEEKASVQSQREWNGWEVGGGFKTEVRLYLYDLALLWVAENHTISKATFSTKRK